MFLKLSALENLLAKKKLFFFQKPFA